MSLSFINHLMIIFTRLVYLILFDRKNAPKLIFYRISKLKFYWVGRTYLVRFGRSLNLFPEIWRECCPIAGLKNDVGKIFIFASFKSYDLFSEENCCFIYPQSLKLCQEKTRQVIKIPRHRFLEKGVKNALRCWSWSFVENRPETNLIC